MNLLKFSSGFVLVIAVFVAGCQHKPTTSAGAKIEERSAGGGAGAGGAGGAGSGETPPVVTSESEVKGTVDPSVVVGQESAQQDLTPAQASDLPSILRVHFAYDSADLDQESLDTLKLHAEYMQKHPGLRLRVEGHSDERGTPEYNLALAEQRAKMVRGALLANRINAGRIEVVSLGEERPLNPGHDEAAWAENRRAELLYNGK